MLFKSFKLYTIENCQDCSSLQFWMERNNIEPTQLINNQKDILKVAREKGIATVPFAEIDGEFVKGFRLIKERLA